MNTEMRTLTTDEIESVAGGYYNYNYTDAHGYLDQYATNYAYSYYGGYANALQALNANQTVVAIGTQASTY